MERPRSHWNPAKATEDCIAVIHEIEHALSSRMFSLSFESHESLLLALKKLKSFICMDGPEFSVLEILLQENFISSTCSQCLSFVNDIQITEDIFRCIFPMIRMPMIRDDALHDMLVNGGIVLCLVALRQHSASINLRIQVLDCICSLLEFGVYLSQSNPSVHGNIPMDLVHQMLVYGAAYNLCKMLVTFSTSEDWLSVHNCVKIIRFLAVRTPAEMTIKLASWESWSTLRTLVHLSLNESARLPIRMDAFCCTLELSAGAAEVSSQLSSISGFQSLIALLKDNITIIDLSDNTLQLLKTNGNKKFSKTIAKEITRRRVLRESMKGITQVTNDGDDRNDVIRTMNDLTINLQSNYSVNNTMLNTQKHIANDTREIARNKLISAVPVGTFLIQPTEKRDYSTEAKSERLVNIKSAYLSPVVITKPTNTKPLSPLLVNLENSPFKESVVPPTFGDVESPKKAKKGGNRLSPTHERTSHSKFPNNSKQQKEESKRPKSAALSTRIKPTISPKRGQQNHDTTLASQDTKQKSSFTPKIGKKTMIHTKEMDKKQKAAAAAKATTATTTTTTPNGLDSTDTNGFHSAFARRESDEWMQNKNEKVTKPNQNNDTLMNDKTISNEMPSLFEVMSNVVIDVNDDDENVDENALQNNYDNTSENDNASDIASVQSTDYIKGNSAELNFVLEEFTSQSKFAQKLFSAFDANVVASLEKEKEHPLQATNNDESFSQRLLKMMQQIQENT